MPSFATDSPIDYKIKRQLLTDVLKTLNLNVDRKRRYKAEKKARINERLLLDKRTLVLKEEEKEKADAKEAKKGGTTPGVAKDF